MPVGHLAYAWAKPVGEPLEFVRCLKRRIDQDQAAPFLWRHEGRKRHPAVEIDNPGLGIAAQRFDQMLARFGSTSQAISRSCGRSNSRAISGDPG